MGAAASSPTKGTKKTKKGSLAAKNLDKDFQQLLQQYEQLHNKDPDHTDNAREWNDFVLKAKDLYDRKREQVQSSIADQGLAERAAVDPHAQELTVLPPDHPEAALQDAKFHHVVIKQGDAFMNERLKLTQEKIGAQIEAIEKAQKTWARKSKSGASDSKEPEPQTEADGADSHPTGLRGIVDGVVGTIEGGIHAIEGASEKIYEKAHGTLKPVLFVPYSTEDPCWSKAAVVALFKTFTHRAKFYVVPDPKHPTHYTYPLVAASASKKSAAAPLRIAIAGDIGTNDTIMKNLLKGIKAQNPHIILHLGDIYVAGTTSECNAFWKSFTSVFPGKDAPPLWSIPGNHEYIDAGEGYFTQLVQKKRLGDPAHKCPQETSYFCLESEEYKLQILALDTGYNSKNFTLPLGGEEMDYSTALTPEEAAWAQERLESAKARGFRTILLTHHQLLSAYWKQRTINQDLSDQVLKAGQPLHAWLWGHEHKIGVYQPTHTPPLVLSGQTLGHGAIPEVTQELYTPAEKTPYQLEREYIPEEVKVYANQQKLFNGGFAMLEIGGEKHDSLLMKYFQVNRLTGECGPRGSPKQLVQGL